MLKIPSHILAHEFGCVGLSIEWIYLKSPVEHDAWIGSCSSKCVKHQRAATLTRNSLKKPRQEDKKHKMQTHRMHKCIELSIHTAYKEQSWKSQMAKLYRPNYIHSEQHTREQEARARKRTERRGKKKTVKRWNIFY